MKTIKVDGINGAFVVENDRHEDDRGWFQELYSTAKAYPHLIGRERQINMSSSKAGVVRGMHVAPFAKLCSCVRGCVYDVVADLRQNSSTYLNWYGIWLKEDDNKQLFVPGGCAHGFFSSQDDTLFLYLQDGIYNPAVETQVNWRDPKLGIKWPHSQEYILSAKDKSAEML